MTISPYPAKAGIEISHKNMAFLPSRRVAHHTAEMIESWRFIPALTPSKQL
jgi:hypothetical protein